MKNNGSIHSKTFQIHLSGIVQGVGFRPFVYNLAVKNNLAGWVCNTASGVYIRFNEDEKNANDFLLEVCEKASKKSKIISQNIQEVKHEAFNGFSIIKSFEGEESDRSITPDYAICEECSKELVNSDNRRNNYAFITCSYCGPRYSIIDKLPYDRELTSMHSFEMCDKCQDEYENTQDRRFFSQTNSCPSCGVKMKLYSYSKGWIDGDQNDLVDKCCEAILSGKIACVKGIGGYMLLGDARNRDTIKILRERKNRKDKPFALMVKDLEMAKSISYISEKEEEAFLSDAAPILLLKQKSIKDFPFDRIAPGLNEVGLMRPYTPLHLLILEKLNFPLIATSGNISGSPIIYKDDEIIEGMQNIADLILSHNRDIKSVQDDSVIRFTRDDQEIIIRRSRGLSPNVFKEKEKSEASIIALGAMLKSTVCLLFKTNTFSSQYIGNSNLYETQISYLNAYHQLKNILNFKEDIVISDKHPGYFTYELAEEIAKEKAIPHIKVQHHEAHFTAVLGENNLWNKEVLGIIWDGTGLGDDGNIWGGEFFSFNEGKIKREAHLPYQKHILGDKMVNEPRIAALSFFKNIEGAKDLLKNKFSQLEWDTYSKLYTKSTLNTSSIGRLFDAVASLLDLNDISSFHGQAAMLLESLTQSNEERYNATSYSITNEKSEFDLAILLNEIVEDLKDGIEKSVIASRFHHSLVDYIKLEVSKRKYKNLAFSGGVFQNKFLVELIQLQLNKDFQLFFNKSFSPNDESISFGQLMHYLHLASNTKEL